MLRMVEPNETEILPGLLLLPQVPHTHLTRVKTESWISPLKMFWRASWVTFKNQSFQTGMKARGVTLACFSSTDVGKEADVQLQAAQFFFVLFLNCLPKPSSIFHRLTAENNSSLKLNRMWKLPPSLETVSLPGYTSGLLASFIRPCVICVNCVSSQISRANTGLSSSCVSELIFYPHAAGSAPQWELVPTLCLLAHCG